MPEPRSVVAYKHISDSWGVKRSQIKQTPGKAIAVPQCEISRTNLEAALRNITHHCTLYSQIQNYVNGTPVQMALRYNPDHSFTKANIRYKHTCQALTDQ